jgi:hypothetical protein
MSVNQKRKNSCFTAVHDVTTMHQIHEQRQSLRCDRHAYLIRDEGSRVEFLHYERNTCDGAGGDSSTIECAEVVIHSSNKLQEWFTGALHTEYVSIESRELHTQCHVPK